VYLAFQSIRYANQVLNIFRNIYSLPDNIRMTKSRMLGWMGHVECVETMRNAYKILI